MRHALLECRFLPPAYHIAEQCMGPAIFEDTTETDPEVLLWDMPVLSLQSPLGLIMWTAVMASWNLRNAVKFRDTPPTWDIFLTQWLCILARWYEHPAPTLPTPEVRDMHRAIASLKETGNLQHPRLSQPHPSPPRLRNPRPRKRKKTCMVQRWRRRIRKSLMSMWRRDGKPFTPTARRRSIRRREWWEGLGYISGITGTRHSASPSLRNKQITGESSSRPYMPFAIGHSTSAH